MELFKLLGTIAIENDEANESIEETSGKAGKVAEALKKGAGVAAKFGAAVVTGTAAAGAALTGIANSAASQADEIDKMSAKIGMSKQAYQEWAYVLGQNGMDVNSLQMGMKTLVAQMDGAASGTEKSVEMFEKLGLSIYDSEGQMKNQEEMFKEVTMALAAMENGTEKAALANDLLGRSGSEMMPMLNNGAEGIVELTDRAHELGLIMGDEAVNAGVVLGDTLDDVKKSAGMVGTKIGVALFPILQKVLDLVLQFMPQVQSIFDGLAPVLIGLMDSLMPMLFSLVENVFPLLVGLLDAILPSFAQLTEAILPVLLQILNVLLPPLIQIVSSLLPVLVQLLQPILNLLSPIIQLLQPILNLIAAIIVPLGNLIGAILTPLISVVTKLIDIALKPLQWIFELLSDTLTSVVNFAFDAVMSKINMVKGVFSGIIQFIKGVFMGDWKSAWEGVKNIFSSIATGIGNIFKSPINFIIDLINNFIKGVNKIEIPDWVPAVGGKGINIPLIPKLARGGILEKGQMGLLEGNGAEAVVPLDQNAKWIRSVSQDMAMQGIGGGIDYDRLSYAVVEAIREVIPELQNTQRIETDESGIFRVVRDKAREFTQKTGNPAFP
jgi:hypothetical protein